jgi:hypothetical protein
VKKNGPSQSVEVKETITSINLTAEQGTQQFEIWADEVGSVGGANVDLSSITSQLAEIMSQNNNTVNYGYDATGNVQTVTEKDPNNNVIKTVTYTYNVVGDVATSVTIMNGKTVTTTYNYDTSGNITSTLNVMS